MNLFFPFLLFACIFTVHSSSLQSAKQKLSSHDFPFEDLPLLSTDPLWEQIRKEVGLTLPEISSLKNSMQLPVSDCHSSQLPIDVFNGSLVLTNIVTSYNRLASVDEKGYLKVFQNSKSFSMDVGFNRGQTTSVWISEIPNSFIIGVEANSQLVSHFNFSPEFSHFRDRAFLIQGAVASKPGVAIFNPGLGWDNVSDTGSLFGWAETRREEVRKKFSNAELTVRLVRLDNILSHVPPPSPPDFFWDTLKIDVQGADVDALISAGDLAKHFACVVGEFDTHAYQMPEGFPVDPEPVLRDLGFIKVFHEQNQIWLNPLYVEYFRNTPQYFACHRVYDSLTSPEELLREYDRLVPQTN